MKLLIGVRNRKKAVTNEIESALLTLTLTQQTKVMYLSCSPGWVETVRNTNSGIDYCRQMTGEEKINTIMYLH